MVDKTTVVHIDDELHKEIKEICTKEGLIFWKFVNGILRIGLEKYKTVRR